MSKYPTHISEIVDTDLDIDSLSVKQLKDLARIFHHAVYENTKHDGFGTQYHPETVNDLTRGT